MTEHPDGDPRPFIRIDFPGPEQRAPPINVVFGVDHVLDVHLTDDLKLRRITVVDADRWLSPAAAMGHLPAYRIIPNHARDELFIEFREGALQRRSTLAIDNLVVNGIEILSCLFSASNELESIVIFPMSERTYLQAD